MNGKHRVVFIRISYLLLDVLSVTLAIVLACWLRSHTLPFPINFPEFLVNYRSPYHFVFLFLVFSILFFNKSYNLYQTRRELQESLEVWNVIKSVVSACILTIVVIYSSKVQGFPRSILILSGLFSAMFLSIWRILKRIFVEFLVVHGYNNFNVLIIGAGKVGMALADEIRKRPGFGFRIVGYLDDFKTQDIPCAGYKVIGKLTDFKKIVKKEFINNKPKTTYKITKQGKIEFLSYLNELKKIIIKAN